jgi:hypothetical protein
MGLVRREGGEVIIRCAWCGKPIGQSHGAVFKELPGDRWAGWHAPWESIMSRFYPRGFCFDQDPAARFKIEELVEKLETRDPRRLEGLPPWLY